MSSIRNSQSVMISVLAMFAILTFCALRWLWVERDLADDLAPFYNNAAYQADRLLEDFPLHKQTYANSCGPATVSMLYAYLVEPVSEQEFAKQFAIPLGKRGMLPRQFAGLLQVALADYAVSHQAAVRDAALLEQIYQQLQGGIPVPIYFSTVNAWDRPNFDTHYSVVIGIRPQQQTVVIANAYGFLEEMTISELLRALKYHNYQHAPLAFRIGQFFGVIRPNNLFLIQP